jgi:hypothetical protein
VLIAVATISAPTQVFNMLIALHLKRIGAGLVLRTIVIVG